MKSGHKHKMVFRACMVQTLLGNLSVSMLNTRLTCMLGSATLPSNTCRGELMTACQWRKIAIRVGFLTYLLFPCQWWLTGLEVTDRQTILSCSSLQYDTCVGGCIHRVRPDKKMCILIPLDHWYAVFTYHSTECPPEWFHPFNVNGRNSFMYTRPWRITEITDMC